MTNKIIQNLLTELGAYLEDPKRSAPLIYVYGLKDSLPQRKDLMITQMGDFISLLNDYKKELENYSGKEINNFTEEENFNAHCTKRLTSTDIDKLNNFSKASNKQVNLKDFIKHKYKMPTLIVELNNGKKRITLFQSINQTYSLKGKLLINIFREDKPQSISYVDNKENIILDANFDMILLERGGDNETENIAFIYKKRCFEDLFNYKQIYNDAYSNIRKELPIINWNLVDISESIKRQCYRLENFDNFSDCLKILQEQLLSKDQNDIKNLFKAKGIPFLNNNGKITISPKDRPQLKIILNTLCDKLAKTCMLKKDVMINSSEDI